MNSPAPAPRFADVHLTKMYGELGIAREYVRASGNTLWYRDEDGSEVAVLDYVGGFGSLLLGHNNPDIVAHARKLLDEQRPVLTLWLGHSHADKLATALNTIVQRELGTDEPHYAIFASTGAEGVEVAIKHSELERQARITELYTAVDTHVEAARAAVASGSATVPDAARAAAGLPSGGDASGSAAFAELAEALHRRNEERRATAPLFLALERAFHGKLTSSIQLTYNPMFRGPFSSLSAQARFLSADDPSQIRKAVEKERVPVLDLVVEGGEVRVVERDFPVFGGFFLEPIRGEAGIRPVSAEYAAEVQRVCEETGIPVIVDEVQSGMGRTGAFFAASQIGLRGDYYILAKSLGGGLAKSAAVLIRESRYQKDLELIHSSTFAKDTFSTLIALRTLELMEEDGGRGYRLATERGERLTAMLEGVKADFPDIAAEVRGRGLMLGFELHGRPDSPAPLIRELSESGSLGYLVSAYLLREHHIRVLPTASSGLTLRLEPSIQLTDEEIDRMEAGLRGAFALLRADDEPALKGEE
ncbi:aminotransferase class III-fold pyridoxal phosphate-dependent enzyme [Streptomyces sp. TRM 70351]|uniref:aspartate aminotransferase family protein n=1 Tax=Streptomyces sp. TRM 70351 TaxID=3116552 RepID=UPI002E7AB60B|nr:aminotransferase class III-fold pyridoxal phosphate-dependent enzyme [Streptomyces sp. TRM 70351]MEE1929754.1 aminotransferase class III-fold pyridoxal phosphate-dependent enzyme [Streptomyces sp. TRM 70351]